MNFSTDRDLLALDPDVFTDAALVSQQRVHVTDAIVDGTTITSFDADFEAAQVGPGSVVLVGRTPLEVIERVDSGTLVVSMLRAHPSDALIPPAHINGDAQTLKARTFAPQAALVADSLLRLLGIDPDSNDPESLTAEAVVSLGAMWKLEALGTLERAYASAAVFDDAPSALAHKAADYRDRFDTARRQASILIDINGDGLAEERRRFGLISLSRV